MYEKSYMHRDVISHTVVTPHTQFIVTASVDGHVKFWKKMVNGIEFVKHYKAHLKAVLDMQCSLDGLYLCTTSMDGVIKFYDVKCFDMVHMINVDYVPTLCVWMTGKRTSPMVAVASQSSGAVSIYSMTGGRKAAICKVQGLHTVPLTMLGYHEKGDCIISGDAKGMIEFWMVKEDEEENGYCESLSVEMRNKSYRKNLMNVRFSSKLDTDLYELAKCKTVPTSIAISKDGRYFAMTAKDKQVRVFEFENGKMKTKYDEGNSVFEEANEDKTLHLDSIDFGRRLAVEKELDEMNEYVEFGMDSVRSKSNVVFDESGHFILFPTLLGIKIINIVTNQLVRVLGRVENTDRFLNISLFQGMPAKNSQFLQSQQAKGFAMKSTEIMTDTPKLDTELNDPCVVATSFKKHRFYLFTTREPNFDDQSDIGRDIFNEKPTAESIEITADTNTRLGARAVIHTTCGDIFIKLYNIECPKTIENFCTHARNGYYDKTIIHRVIKNFMIQMGDPQGDGTGGESIWGGEFQDEFHRSLRHDRAFTVSMANAGPNTNGSQFFITTVPTPWLDNKHTVFGRVESGQDVVSSIEQAETDHLDALIDEVSIINIDIL